MPKEAEQWEQGEQEQTELRPQHGHYPKHHGGGGYHGGGYHHGGYYGGGYNSLLPLLALAPLLTQPAYPYPYPYPYTYPYSPPPYYPPYYPSYPY